MQEIIMDSVAKLATAGRKAAGGDVHTDPGSEGSSPSAIPCHTCNDHHWIMWRRETSPGWFVPELRSCPDCNADAKLPPPVYKEQKETK